MKTYQNFVLPSVYNNENFDLHLELQQIAPEEYGRFVCHACDGNLTTLAEKHSDQAKLYWCLSCYLYVCKDCDINDKHKLVCTSPMFDDVT